MSLKIYYLRLGLIREKQPRASFNLLKIKICLYITLGALLQDGVNASGITMGGVSGTNPRNVSLANNNNLAIVSSNQPDNISITNISSDNPFFVAFMASEQFKNYNASQFGDLDYNGAKRYD